MSSALRYEDEPLTADPTPELVPQPHGGAILRGGVRGNKGGRPPSLVKAACREAFAQRIPVLERIADDETAPSAERIRAVEALGKHAGLSEQSGDIMSHPDARRFLASIYQAIESAVRAHAPAQAERILGAIEAELARGMAA